MTAVVMSGHHAVPGLTGRDDLPATLAPAVMSALLRRELGFEGLAITDAIDMQALAQGDGQLIDALAALRAGVDLLLCPGDLDVVERLSDGLALAVHRGLLEPPSIRATALRSRLATAPEVDPAVVGCAAHQALAHEVARHAVTLISDTAGLLPLQLDADATLLAVQVAPSNLTPADVSRTVTPHLAAALRAHHPRVEELVVSRPPTAEEIAGARERATQSEAVVVGTAAAHRDATQAELVHALLATGVPVVTAALRTPWDLAAYPASTHLCTYGILRPDLDALAAAIFTGEALGHLPVAAPS